MRTCWALAVVAAFGLAAAAALSGARPAFACSSPDDPVQLATVLVRGTVVGWDYVRGPDGQPTERIITEPAYSRPEWQPHARPIVMKLVVRSALTGTQAPVLLVRSELYDRYLRAEGSPPFGYWAWPAEAGVCFGLSDPTGQDLLFPLQPTADGSGLQPLGFAWPYSADLEANWRERAGLPPMPPGAGNSPAARSPSQRPAATLLLVAAGLFIAAGGALIGASCGVRRSSRGGRR